MIKVVIILLLMSTTAIASTYHVTTTGSDSADCSLSTPCATVEHVCDLVVAGDTIKVHGDGDPLTIDYSQGAICSVSGTSENRITIEGYDANDRPTFSYAPAYTGGWTNVGTNLWRTTNTVTIGGQEVYGFYKYDPTIGSTTVMNREFSTGAVDSEGDWYAYKGVTFPNKFLLYSVDDPNAYTGEWRFIDVNTNVYYNGLVVQGDYYTLNNINYKFSWIGFTSSSANGPDGLIFKNLKTEYCINRGISIGTSASNPASNILIQDVETSYGIPSYAGYSVAPDQHGIKFAASENAISGNNLTVINTLSHHNNYHGLQISEAWQGVTIRGGQYHDNNLGNHNDGANIRLGTTTYSTGFEVTGVESYNTKYGINLFANINNVRIHGNTFHDASVANVYMDNASASWETCPDENCYVYNNIIRDSDDAGVLFDDAENWKVYNNTIVGNVGSGVEVADNLYYSFSGEVRNNIIVAPTGANLIEIASGESATLNYNAFYSPDATPFSYAGTSYNFSDYKTASGQDANSISSNFTGEFIDYASGNYRLTPSSTTLKDAGTSLSLVPYDKLGQIRPQGSGYSIGAYEEYIEGTTVGGLTITGATIN